jgi:hypothetical protein
MLRAARMCTISHDEKPILRHRPNRKSVPPGTWSRGHVADLRKSLEGVVQAYCSRLPPPSERNFSGLISALVAAIKAAEQTANAGKVAA